MVKVFLIIGLLLFVAGVPGLYWSSLQTDQIEQRIAFCKAKYSHQVDEYVHKLTGSSLNPSDPTTIDLSTAVNVEKMSPSQRLTYQQERLLADIDELAASPNSAPANANVVYGNDWRQKVAEYKDRRQFLTAVHVASATAAIAGGVLFATAFVFLFFRIVIGSISWIIRLFTGKKGAPNVKAERPIPIQEDRFIPPAVTISNLSTPTPPKQSPRSAGPTAEEFRKLLMAQTESLKETVEQLKNVAGVLQRDAEHDRDHSKSPEGSKSQTEGFKDQNGLLKKLADDIRKSVEAESNDLSKAIENAITSHAVCIQNDAAKSLEAAQAVHKETVRLHGDGLNNIKQLIDELTRAVCATTASQQSGAANVSEKVEQLLNVQTENLKKEVKPLNEVIGTLSQRLEQIQTSISGDNSEAALMHAEELNGIKKQIGELTAAVHMSASQQSDTADVSAKVAQLLNVQTESLKKEVKPLNEIIGSLGQKLEHIQNSISGDSSEAARLLADGLNNIKKQIEELKAAVRMSASGQSDAAEVSAKVAQLLNVQTENLKKEVKPLNEIIGSLGQKLEHIQNSISGDSSEAARLLVEGLNTIKKQIEELKAAVRMSSSGQSDAAEVSAKVEQLLNAQTENLKKEVKPLKEIISTLGQTLEQIQNSMSGDSSESVRLHADGLNNIRQQIDDLTAAIHTAGSQQPGSSDVTGKIDSLLNEQTESIKKQIEPLKDIAGMLEQTLEEIKSSKPSDSGDEQLKQETKLVRQISEESLQKGDAIGKSIADLTEQVCAIREYAARQQQRLAKLQDGYDWNLIKNFCLRVIRCVDNLDDRLAELSESGGSVEHLQAVREELVFVLESNGIEPFGAKVDSDYRGQENRLQVLNERDETDDSNLAGKIAQVVRPGYQCRVNDEYTKIVRPAHVRLYGSTCLNNTAVRGE